VIRRQRYRELASRDTLAALRYLQTEVSATVEHSDEHEAANFRRLASDLFGEWPATDAGDDQDELPSSSSRSLLSIGMDRKSVDRTMVSRRKTKRANRFSLFLQRTRSKVVTSVAPHP